MEENKDKNVVNHFEAGSNCQVFNGPVSGCVFAMPGSTVTQNALQPVRDLPEEQSPNEQGPPLNPPIKGEDNPSPRGSQEGTEELNYFGPTNSLQRLLKQPWLTEVRSSKEYDAQWTDAFVVALMASEWRDAIAREWAVQGKRNKRMQIKGYVIGLLIDAGVLKGGYDSVASKMGVENARSLSKYMGMGKKQPYAEWVRKYV